MSNEEAGTAAPTDTAVQDPAAKRSQALRRVNFQGDSLRLAMDWSVADLSRPQVLIESVYGQSHPGSYHLDRVMRSAEKGVLSSGGKPAAFFATDVCDGIAQSHDGMHYSLVSREIIADLVEIHAMAHPYDAIVAISSCDKAVPAHLIALARLDLPAVHVPGGSNLSGPGDDYLSSDQLWSLGDRILRGEAEAGELLEAQLAACPTCGACQFMGTASTMQVLSEGLGMSLPGTALVPSPFALLGRRAEDAGAAVLELARRGIRPRDILTREAFENAIMIHAAVGGSTNATLHLPAIAREVGIDISAADFDRIGARIPVLADVKTAGRFPTEYLWYAGGVPAIQERLRPFLHLDCLTVTGHSVGENLAMLERIGFVRQTRGYLMQRGVRAEEVLRPLDRPVYSGGDIAVLRGSLAPEGAVVKARAVDPGAMVVEGPALVFEREADAVDALVQHRVEPGSVVVIRWQGPRGIGMPEMFHATEALVSDPRLRATTAIVTDGRFSGASRGPCVGHVSPEAARNGPIAVVQAGDRVRVDIPARRLDLVGADGRRLEPAAAEALLAKRLRVAPPERPPWARVARGVLGLYQTSATSAMAGASLLPGG